MWQSEVMSFLITCGTRVELEKMENDSDSSYAPSSSPSTSVSSTDHTDTLILNISKEDQYVDCAVSIEQEKG